LVSTGVGINDKRGRLLNIFVIDVKGVFALVSQFWFANKMNFANSNGQSIMCGIHLESTLQVLCFVSIVGQMKSYAMSLFTRQCHISMSVSVLVCK
jgi:hypothetical protein